MGKYQDEVELVMSARNETVAELRRAEQHADAMSRRQAQRERESLDMAKRQIEERRKVGLEGYKKAERDAADAGQRAASAFEQPLIKAALRAVAVFGSLELGLGTANVLSKAFSGNMEDAAEAVERLPAIGGFARQLKETLGHVTGITKEIQSLEMTAANMAQASGARAAAAAENLKNLEEVARRVRDLNQDTALRGIGDQTARSRAQERVRAANALSEIRGEVARLRRERAQLLNDPALTATQEKERDKLAQEIEDLKKKRSDFIEDRKEKGYENPESFAIVRRYNSEIAALQSQIKTFDEIGRARELKLENFNRQIERQSAVYIATRRNNAAREAELEKNIAEQERRTLQERFRQRAEIEKRAEQERLRQQKQMADERRRMIESQERSIRDLRLNFNRMDQEAAGGRVDAIRAEIARLNGQIASSAPRNTADQNRFLTGVAERSASLDRQTNDPQRQTLERLEKLLAAAERQVASLKAIEDQIKNGPVIVGGIFGSNN